MEFALVSVESDVVHTSVTDPFTWWKGTACRCLTPGHTIPTLLPFPSTYSSSCPSDPPSPPIPIPTCIEGQRQHLEAIACTPGQPGALLIQQLHGGQALLLPSQKDEDVARQVHLLCVRRGGGEGEQQAHTLGKEGRATGQWGFQLGVGDGGTRRDAKAVSRDASSEANSGEDCMGQRMQGEESERAPCGSQQQRTLRPARSPMRAPAGSAPEWRGEGGGE